MTNNNNLYYHKCKDCLTAFTTHEKHVDFCDCNGEVTFMGQVHGDVYQKVEDKCACDARCTHASGPHCDCVCGGANHGTGKVVQVVVKEGKVQAVGLTEEDIKRADAYRSLRDYAWDLYEKRYTEAKKSVNEYRRVDPHLYYGIVNDKRELQKICEMKLYDARTKKLIEFVTKMQKHGQ